MNRNLDFDEYAVLDALVIIRDKQRAIALERDFETWRMLDRICDRYMGDIARNWKRRWEADSEDLRAAFHAVRRVG